jgi:hypothetical protein
MYNLITLFIGEEELAALGQLLTMQEAVLRKRAAELGPA